MYEPQLTLWRVLRRGFRLRCPRCGKATLYRRWNQLHEQCRVCRWVFFADKVDGMAFMYISTAAITGLFVIGFLLIGFPTNWGARMLVVGIALVIMVATLPVRKSLAIALDFLSRKE